MTRSDMLRLLYHSLTAQGMYVHTEVCPEESRTDFARKKRKEIDNRLESEIVS